MRKTQISPQLIYYIYRSGFSFAFCLLTTIFSIYHINIVNMNPFQLIIVGTILEASCFIFEIPTGILADNYSRKLSIVIGLIIMGIGIFIEGFFPLFFMVAIAQVIWGFGATFLSGADTAWISDEVAGQGLDKILIKGAQYSQAAIFIGIFISLGIASYKVHFPILLSGILLILLGVFLFLFMPENKFKPAPKHTRNPWFNMFYTFKKGIIHVKTNKILIGLFLVTIFTGLYSEGYDRLWTFRFLKDIDLPDLGKVDPIFWFAIIKTVAIIINLALLELIKKKIIHKKPVFIYWTLFLIYAILNSSIFVFAMTGNFHLMLASFWISHAMRNANEPLTEYLYNKNITDSNIRATVLSMRGQVDQLGQVVGGPLIGVVANVWSVSTGLIMSGIFIIPILVIYLFIIQMKHS